ncbi:alpha-amylase family glycosyl hydrolase [Natronogracilivirga saccharolytica]
MFRNGDRFTGSKIAESAIRWGARQMDTFCLFRLYCPKAELIELVIFETYEQQEGESHSMNKLDDGSWHLKLPGDYTGFYYAYRISHPKDNHALLHTDHLIADPWSLQVKTLNHYQQHARTRIVSSEPFDWEGDTFVIPEEQRDLVIYEAHVKDLTAHPSAGSSAPGTYNGFIEPGITGGIEHLKRLGVNAVEFLPLQKAAGFEPPFNKNTPEGFLNTWNPYSRNYWGYMTSFFFAPETLYASDAGSHPGEYGGSPEVAARELKQVIKELHKAGIAVIMDVVYNHVSQYDLSPLKYTDQQDFFRTDHDGNLTSESGCGNDLRTEDPYIRDLIVSSVVWWMKEYHIDGFRFDLANLIDRQTIAEIRKETDKINPNALLIAEPWGGGYDPTGFSGHGWSSWNDQIRNGVKGYDPIFTPGFIFGRWHYETNREALENYIRGTLIHESNGRFHRQEHALNYLESHDGYTLGDFIRIALDHQKKDKQFDHKLSTIALDEQEMRCAKLAALFLFTSQGIPMIHQGQEWARSKWIVPENNNDPDAQKLDHNSYEKDNATNYLDFSEIGYNPELFDYYRGLIRLRKNTEAFRLAKARDINFHPYEDARHITFEVSAKHTPETVYLVSLNGNPDSDHAVHLPEGKWDLIADHSGIYADKPVPVRGKKIDVPRTSGIILRRTSA